MHHKLLQHWHHPVVVLREIAFHHRCYDSDGCDRLFLHHSVLRGLQATNQLLHELSRVSKHQCVVQLLAKRHKGAHGHCCHSVDLIIKLLEEDRHDSLVPCLLKVGRLIIRKLSQGMQGCIPDTGVRVVHMAQQQLCHLIRVLGVLYILDSLLHGRESGKFRLPCTLRREVANELEQPLSDGFHTKRLGNSIDCLLTLVEELIYILLTFFVVHSCHPLLELLLTIFNLQHHVHAALKHQWRHIRQALCEPLRLLLHVHNQPLQGDIADGSINLVLGFG
mmetsp:Transcript_66641/g.159285  ORF Transcript_66641/g.159285 Transcript_66641/m.159285 type:complete len:278 (+) Transcript_66641:1085-1918(+)